MYPKFQIDSILNSAFFLCQYCVLLNIIMFIVKEIAKALLITPYTALLKKSSILDKNK